MYLWPAARPVASESGGNSSSRSEWEHLCFARVWCSERCERNTKVWMLSSSPPPLWRPLWKAHFKHLFILVGEYLKWQQNLCIAQPNCLAGVILHFGVALLLCAGAGDVQKACPPVSDGHDKQWNWAGARCGGTAGTLVLPLLSPAIMMGALGKELHPEQQLS